MKILPFALSAFAILTASLHGQNDAPPIDVDAVLKSLEEVGAANQTTNQQLLNRSLNEIHQALASSTRAIELYEKAIRATTFAGHPEQGADFQAWKKKQGEKLRSSEFRQALQFHLQYLSMTLRFSAGTPVKELLPELIAYTNDIYAAKPVVLREDVMRKAISDSVFARWLGLGHYTKGVKGWEMVPLAADGMWEKTILPELRLAKSPEIVRYWDERLKREATLAAEERLDFAADTFDNVTRPTLLWRRAEELAVLGSRNQAINEMLALVKNFPTHPNNAAWINQIKEMLAPAEAKAE